MTSPRAIKLVLADGATTGVIAGLATGAIDALWSWGPAAQFAPGFLARARFVMFSASTHAAAGALVGVVLAGILLVLSRASWMGDVARRERDPLNTLAIVIVTLPCMAAALYLGYRFALPNLAHRKVPSLVIAVAMVIAIGCVAIAIPIAAVIARGVERGLRAIPKPGVLANRYAPYVAAGVLLVGAGVVWAVRDWETARVLPLRGPVVIAVGLALAIPALPPARRIVDFISDKRPAIRRTVWIALPFVLVALVIANGNSAGVVKAASAYTGLCGPIARGLRKAFDWDRDGYARFLGGGDCDDGDRTVHPGAPENPDDGIDQNCVGGDATLKRSHDDMGFVPVPPTVSKDFDILLVTIDTTRADHLATYGYKRDTMPNVDKLAKQGTVFEHGWAHAPSTRYSMPAILTGRLPLDVDYDNSVWWPALAPKATTIAEALQALGFVTGAITNYDYFRKERRMDQGFQEYDNENEVKHQIVGGNGPEQTKGSSSKEQTDKALAYVERHANDRWFLWVHYYDPHFAYEPHSEVKSFGGSRIDLYDGELLFTDFHLARLLEKVGDNTVVVITGDHGEGFGEHKIELHGFDLYSPQTKVPLIIRVPGVTPRRSTTPAGHIDILPTLVNLAGGSAAPEMMGSSLVGPIAGTDRDRVVFQQVSSERGEKRGGADAKCHVIYNVSPDTSWEVYRVDRDPLETRDLAGDDECSKTRTAVAKWFDTEQIPRGAAQALLPSRPTIANPIEVDYGDDVRLLAVEHAPSVKAGETLEVTWTFEAKGAVPPGWKMFVHIEGPAKSFINGDHRPARPFEWWKTGEFIRYPTTITIPRTAARGTYTINAGMFKGTKRAPAKSARAKIQNNAAAVATFEVAP